MFFFVNYLFRLCDDIDPSNANDIANLYSTLAGNFEGVVQYNKDNRGFEVREYETIYTVRHTWLACMLVFIIPCARSPGPALCVFWAGWGPRLSPTHPKHTDSLSQASAHVKLETLFDH